MKKYKKIFVFVLIIMLVLALIIPYFMGIKRKAKAQVLTTTLLGNNKPLWIDNNGIITFNSEKVYDILEDFLTNNPNRESGTENEKNSADYLQGVLENLGYNPYKGKYQQEFSLVAGNADGTNHIVYSQNVVGTINSKNATEKQIIIGAHYDNVSQNIQSQGAYDNGSGVAGVIALADVLSTANLPYNVVIVFFGMEESGLYGSENFVKNMTKEEKDNTLLMINLDSISCGDYLYAFSDEIPRTHEKIFFESSEKVNFPLRKMPYDKKTVGIYTSFTKPFTHIGLQSDNAYFVEEKIPAISFVGYNLESKQSVVGEEGENKIDIMHTGNDTLSGIIEIYGEDVVLERLGKVPSLIATTLLNEDFVAEMEYSKDNPTVIDLFYKKWFFLVVVGVFFLAFALVVVLLYIKYNKEKPEKVTINFNNTNNDDGYNIKVDEEKGPDVFDF